VVEESSVVINGDGEAGLQVVGPAVSDQQRTLPDVRRPPLIATPA
jgi:hypothetical protein